VAFAGGNNRHEFEVFRNMERGHVNPDYRVMHLPVGHQIEISDNTNPPPSSPYLELHRHRASMHLSYELLEDLFHVRINPMLQEAQYVNALDRLIGMLALVSRETESRLQTMQPVDEGHPVILDRVRIVNQPDSRLILIDMLFWAVRGTDADLGRLLFERTLHEVLSGNISEIPSNGTYAIERPYVEPKRYNDDAEEHAHELLKSMLTNNQFKIYKDEGFVIIKGTYGRVYKVRKKDMITVTQKRRGKTKEYRLCLEPREHGKICPTDEVIAKIKLIQADEKKLHELGNRFDDYGTHNLTVNSDGSISVEGTSLDEVLSFDSNGIAGWASLDISSNSNSSGTIDITTTTEIYDDDDE